MEFASKSHIEINNFDEFLKFIKRYTESRCDELWFRGHNSNFWKLKPNLYRNAKINVTDGIALLNYDFVDFKKEFDTFKKLIEESNLFNYDSLNDFQLMFIAQHHGILTPILDWTTDPLVALFFAIDDYNDENEECFPVFYIFKPALCNKNSSIRFNNSEGETDISEALCIDEYGEIFDMLVNDLNDTPANHIPIAIYSNHEFSSRVCRQSGKFTLHGACGPLNYNWNDITIGNERFVDTIKINPQAVPSIQEYLKALNINKNTIYREIYDEFDNQCNKIKSNELEKYISSLEKY